MKLTINKLYIGLLPMVTCSFAFADLPLTVEDLITDKNKFKLTTNISYFNQSQRNLTEQGYSFIDLGNGRTLSLPNPPTEGTSNTDSLIGTLGLNYGATDKWELGVKANALYRQTRFSASDVNNQQTDRYLQDVSVTTQYQTTENHKTLPDSLVFSEISVYDKTDGLDSKSLSSVLVGGTVYTINDPIVLSLTSSYQYSAKRDILDRNKIVDIGDVLSVNGSIGFAVNPDITLNTGVGWQLRQADKIDGKEVGGKQTQTNLSLGMAYAVSERNNLTANLRTNVSGQDGSTFSVGLTTKLGALPQPLSERYKKRKKP